MTELDRQIDRLKARGYKWPIPWEVVELMARAENCILVSYLCPSKVWTIGWGETEGLTPGSSIVPGMKWTEDQADARFYQQVVKYTQKVEDMLEVPANENQLGAMVSLTYNIGFRRDKPTKGGFYWTSVRRLHNAGDTIGAARSFGLINKGRDRVTGELTVLPGLVTRRADEAALYLRPVEGTPHERMPQAVEGESKLTASPIAQGGVVTAGTGILAGAAQVADQINEKSGVLGSVKSAMAAVKDVVHGAADLAGVPPGVLLAIVLVIAGVVIINNRRRQRQEGWA